MQKVAVRCCIAGGGPAGVMAGLLLARAGVDVMVLEKHADFFRDFRGDTIHPSTLELMDELGSFDVLLKLPHQKAHHLSFQFGDLKGVVADFDGFRLPLTEAERARRQGLTPRQQELLETYGYPYVFEEFRFHMTLTDRIEDAAERARFAEAIGDFFGFMAEEEVALDRLVLFREAAPGAPFRRLRDYLLTGEA